MLAPQANRSLDYQTAQQLWNYWQPNLFVRWFYAYCCLTNMFENFMSCNCNSPEIVTSWNEWANVLPANPLDLIANARLDSTSGVLINSNSFSHPSGSALPIQSPFLLNGKPTCVALNSSGDDPNDALQWNFAHLTRNLNANLAPPLDKVIFLRSGLRWEMKIPINLGTGVYSDLQLSFRDNAGTRGDTSGTVPVIAFNTSATFTGGVVLTVTLKYTGHAVMGLRAIDNGGNWSMYESEWIIVP